MKKVTLVAVLAVSLGAGSVVARQDPVPPPKPTPTVSLAGAWTMAMEIENMGAASVALAFTQEGEKLTGTYTGRYGAFPLEGTVKARAVEFTVFLRTDAGDSTMYFAGLVAEDGKSIAGTGSIEGLGAVSWSAKPKPPSSVPR